MPDKPTTRLHNKPSLTERRRKLRHKLTPAEAALWNVLKNAKLDGRKFRRQHSLGPFILDFYCVEESLAIELDGQAHRNENAEVYDLKRTAYLRKAGIRVLRFENFLVFDEVEYVLNCIRSHFGWKKESTTPSTEAVATPPIQEGSFGHRILN